MTLLLSVGGMPADRARARTVVLMLVGVNRRRGNDGHGLECANSREVRRPPSRREERGAHMRLARSFTALGLILFATRLLAAETATARVASVPPSLRAPPGRRRPASKRRGVLPGAPPARAPPGGLQARPRARARIRARPRRPPLRPASAVARRQAPRPQLREAPVRPRVLPPHRRCD